MKDVRVIEILGTLAIVLLGVSAYIFQIARKALRQNGELADQLKAAESGMYEQQIALARVNEKLVAFEGLDDKLRDLQTVLSEKQNELLHVRELYTTSKTALEEQRQKFEEFTDAGNVRVAELKGELEKQKELNAGYNEEIKQYRAHVSELETTVVQTREHNQKSLQEKEQYIDELKQNITRLSDEKKELQIQVTRDKGSISTLQTQLQEQAKAMEEKLQILQNSEAKLKTEFENLANKIFTDNSKKFREQNQESLGLILNPMKQQLSDFKKKVEDVYDKEAKDRSALQQELKTLKELNQQMSVEAHKLTTALRSDTKKQGKWGEMVLENVLESSGLREGHEYRREVNLKDGEDKAFRPDVIVNLPDQRHIIIDAKTSLAAYSEYMAEESEELKQVHLKNHIRSVKEHIRGLADKKYEDLKGVNTLDFIFMFVPIEGALLAALDNDVNLYDEAFKQKIILVSPTTLLVALRAVENTWRYERQAQNIADVYARATKLYEKVDGFVVTLENVGKHIKKADSEYEKAFGQLATGSGNLIRQATMLKQVANIKPKKELDNALVENAMLDTAIEK
jgi:DNA recombination protein RmuC